MQKSSLSFAILSVASFICLVFGRFVVTPGAQSKPARLEGLERAILDEMNLARTHPQQYAAFLEETKKFYNGKRFQPATGRAYTTNEGVKAVEEAIAFLRAAKPLAPLVIAGGMCSAAREHAKDLTLRRASGHKGGDGSTTEDRVNRYGIWRNAIGENIAYESTSAREVVMGWIIDDGLASRGHRKHLFNANYSVVGIATESGSDAAPTCVTTFAGGFSDKPAVTPRGATRRKLYQ